MREVLGEDFQSLLSRVVQIEELFLFVIVPSEFQLLSAFPPLKYMRLLEGRDWESYLDRAIAFVFPNAKMVIYQWRSEKGIAIEPNNPFRGFLEFVRGVGSVGGLTQQVYATLLTLLLVLTFYYAADLLPTPERIVSLAKWAVSLLVGVGLLALAKHALGAAEDSAASTPLAASHRSRFREMDI